MTKFLRKIAKNMANELFDETPANDPKLLFTGYKEAFKKRRQELQTWLEKVRK
ncbi:MAG: hypothetical protein HC907_36090 [Richelia sp. SM1_7_0]|nr:hypothetical protein [Richelia sp. SM1_7_0]